MGRGAPELLLRQTKKELKALQKIIDTSLLSGIQPAGFSEQKNQKRYWGTITEETKAVAIVATSIIS